MRVHRQRAIAGEEQGMAIGLGPGHDVASQHAARAGSVLHDDGLRQARLEAIGHDARGRVDGAASREADDQAHRALRIVRSLRQS